MEVIGLDRGEFAILCISAIALAIGFVIASKNLGLWLLGLVLVLGSIEVGLRIFDEIGPGLRLILQCVALTALSAQLMRSRQALPTVVGVIGVVAGIVVLIIALPGLSQLGLDGTASDILVEGWRAIVNIFTTANDTAPDVTS